MVFGICKLQNLHSLAKSVFFNIWWKIMSYELLNFHQSCDNYKIPSYTDRLFGKAEIQITTFVHN